MSWQLAIIGNVIVSALMAIMARRLSLTNRRAFYIVGFMTYLMIALAGIVYSSLFGVPWDYLPTAQQWLYILPAGIGIAAAWLLHYRMIGIIGASNAVIASMANYIGTAILGFIFLQEGISGSFILGAALILVSIWLTFRIRADDNSGAPTRPARLIIIMACMVIAYSFGMMFEKVAIDSMGVWQYARYGWAMQLAAATFFMLAVGRQEIFSTDRQTILKAAMLGLVTSVAGVLYIYALSAGSLSGTILASSAKIALTSVLAYVFLRERNALPIRLLALALTVLGLWLIF